MVGEYKVSNGSNFVSQRHVHFLSEKALLDIKTFELHLVITAITGLLRLSNHETISPSVPVLGGLIALTGALVPAAAL